MQRSWLVGRATGRTALVAQYYGAGERRLCPVVTNQSLIAALFIYPVVLVCLPLADHLFRMLGVPASQIEAQLAFFDVMTYGCILIFVRQSLASFFSGIGRTRVVMTASLVAMAVNVAASYVLIYGKWGAPALGIRGAALGALTGSACAVLVLAWAYFSKENRAEFSIGTPLKFHPEVFRKLLRFGSPSGFELLLTLMAANGFVLAFQSLGPAVATASSILMNWDMSAYIPLMGMEVGVMSLVGRYMGAGNPDLAHRAAMSGLKVGCVYAVTLLIVFSTCAAPMVDLFRPAGDNLVFAEARPMAVTMLRMVSIYMFSIAFVIVFVGALRGAGDTLWAMTYHIALHWLAAGILYVSTRFLGLSALKAWALVIVAFVLFSGIAFLRYRAGKWRSIRVVG